jgi:hypothetical protein
VRASSLSGRTRDALEFYALMAEHAKGIDWKSIRSWTTQPKAALSGARRVPGEAPI